MKKQLAIISMPGLITSPALAHHPLDGMPRLARTTASAAIESRLAGAVVAGVGIFLTLEIAEGVVFNALGVG